ncbi:hypothetical protein K523DRAFT_269806 [Schizophyllum commune Tattone D]|nr:hypothetical protein K523DRAFT_269806 [Schizophyllum commune Tattone D]
MAYRQTLPLFALTGGSALIALGTCFLRPCLDSPDTGSLYYVPPATETSSTAELPLDTSSAQNIHQIPSFSNYAQPSTDSYRNHLTTDVVRQVPIHALQCSPSEAPLPNYFLPEYCVLPPPSSASISASTLSSSFLIIAFCLSLFCGWVVFSFRCRITALCFKMTAALAFKGYLSFVLYDDLLDKWTGAQVPRAIMSDDKLPVKRSSSQLLPSLMVSDSDVNCPRPAPPFRNLARSLQDAVAEDLDDIPNGRFTVIHPPRYATRRATDSDCRYQAYKRVYIGAEPEVGQDRQDGLADGSAHVPYRTITFGPQEKDDDPSPTESCVAGASRPPLLLLANVLPTGFGSEEVDPLSNTLSAMPSRPSRRSSLSVSFSDELKYRILSPMVDNGVDRFASNSLSSPFLGSTSAQDEKLSPLPRRRSTEVRTGREFRDARRSTAALDASRSAASRYASRSTTVPDAGRSMASTGTGRLTASTDNGSRALPHHRSLDSDDWERSSTSSRASSMFSRASNLSSRTSSQSLSRSFGRLSLDSDDWELSSVSSRASYRSASSTVSRSSSRAGSRLSTLALSRLGRSSAILTGGSPRSSVSSSSRYSSSSRASSRASSPSASDTESLRSLNDESLLPYDNDSLLSDNDENLPFASPSTPTPARSRASTKRRQRPEAGWPKEEPEDEDMEPMTADGQFNMAWWHKRKEAENRPSTPSVISVVG